MVLTFLYTTCRDTCPLTATQIRGALDDLDRDVPALAVSVDPANDTRRARAAFLFKRGLGDDRMRFLLGTRAQLAPVWKAYGIRPQGDGLRPLRLRAARRQARAPAGRLPGRAAHPRGARARHPPAAGRGVGSSPSARRRGSSPSSLRPWKNRTTARMTTGAR